MKELVIVNWVDIVAWSGWNDELIEANEDKPAEYNTVGFLLREDEERVTITDTYPDVGNVVTFPVGCIKSIIKIDIPAKKGKKK